MKLVRRHKYYSSFALRVLRLFKSFQDYFFIKSSLEAFHHLLESFRFQETSYTKGEKVRINYSTLFPTEFGFSERFVTTNFMVLRLTGFKTILEILKGFNVNGEIIFHSSFFPSFKETFPTMMSYNCNFLSWMSVKDVFYCPKKTILEIIKRFPTRYLLIRIFFSVLLNYGSSFFYIFTCEVSQVP